MARLIGRPDWVREAGFPQLSGKSGDEKIIDQYTATPAGLAMIPAYGTPFGVEGLPDVYKRSYLVLSEIAITPVAGAVYKVKLTYVTPSFEPTETMDMEEYQLTTQEVTVPLAQHKNYRLCWDNVLMTDGLDGYGVPDWWYTVKYEDQIPEGYIIAAPGSAVPEGYVLIARETKPGVTGFVSGVKVVHYTKKSHAKGNLQNDAGKDFTIDKPGETFGISGSWLRGGSTIVRQGKYWQMSVDYTNVRDIDRDLYQ